MMTLDEAVKKVRPLDERLWRGRERDGTVLQSHCILWENWRIC